MMGSRLPTLPQMARRLGTSARSLQRKLGFASCTYSQVLETTVRESALWHLRHSPLTNEEVAFHHGYASSSAFVRAVRRWTGMTPRAYRRGAQ